MNCRKRPPHHSCDLRTFSKAAAIVPAPRLSEVLLAFVTPFCVHPLPLDEPRSRESMRAWAPSTPGASCFVAESPLPDF